MLDAARPGTDELLPRHGGSVACMVARDRDGTLVTGAQDGTLRVWDVGVPEDAGGPKALFAFGGYRVWLSSVATDNTRLVADGSDNTVLVHDFSKDAPPPGGPLNGRGLGGGGGGGGGRPSRRPLSEKEKERRAESRRLRGWKKPRTGDQDKGSAPP